MKTTTLAGVLVAAMAFGIAGCGDSGGGSNDPAPSGGTPAAGGSGGSPVDAPDAGGGAGGTEPVGGAGPHPGGGTPHPEPQALTRAPGRMTVETLRRSIPVITNGINWEEDFGDGNQTDVLEALSATLGAPDYLLVTEENLEPSLIIAKFMQDASNRICPRWVERDRGEAAASRSLVAHAGAWDSRAEADVKVALRALRLRFFGHRLPADGSQDAVLTDLLDLFNTASATSAPGREAQDGWLAVCIALMTDPEMVLY